MVGAHSGDSIMDWGKYGEKGISVFAVFSQGQWTMDKLLAPHSF